MRLTTWHTCAERAGGTITERRKFKPDFKQNPNSNVSNKFETISNFGRLEKYFPAQKN
jgi:hypothetical protein